MRTVKIGIVGLGYWGPNVLRNFAAQESCEMVAACDKNPETIAKLRRQYPSIRYTANFADLTSNPEMELILIATPTETHFPLAKSALLQDKHVFIEKPMTSSLREAEELVELAAKRKKLIFVDHTFAFAPAVDRITQMVKGGELGELLYFDSVRISLGLIQQDTNVLWDLAIHDLTILSQIMNLDDVVSVAAHGSKHFGQQEEQVHVHLTFRSRFAAHIHVSWLSPVKVRQTILAGSKAMIIYDDIEPSEKLRLYDRGVERDASKPDPFFPKYRAGDIHIPALPMIEPLSIEAAHVLACVQGKEDPRVSGADAMQIIKILERGNESLRRHSSPVNLR